MSQKHSHRVPAGETLLTIMAMEDTGFVLLISAQIEEPVDLEEALFGPEACLEQVPDATVDAGQPSDGAPAQIISQATLVECQSLPDDFFNWAISRFDGAIYLDPESQNQVAVCLPSATPDEILCALREEDIHLSVRGRPEIATLEGQWAEVQVGQAVPVVSGITFLNDQTIPIVEQQSEGIFFGILPTVLDDGCIELQLKVTHTDISAVETVLYSAPAPDRTITSPFINSVSAESSVTAPQGATVVLPMPSANSGATAPTILLILTPREVE